MNEAEIAGYFVRVEKVVSEVYHAKGTFQQLCEGTEPIVSDLTSRIRSEGVDYSTNNEPNATARALLWIGWVSWMWTSKAERADNPDIQAKMMRPIVENLIQQFIETGRRFGKEGKRPEAFLTHSEDLEP